MTLREKQRLRRMIASNAAQYRDKRREIATKVVLEEDPADLRRSLVYHAIAIAEAVSSLEDHADPGEGS